MKVHYYSYRVLNSNESLKRVIQRISNLELGSREHGAERSPILAEHISVGTEFIETDFTLRRMTGGPGLSKRGEQTKDFEFTEGQGFGEQTAVVWSVDGYAAVQYNHRGPKSVGIQNYLKSFIRGGEDTELELLPFVDPDIWNRFLSSNEHISLECTIDARALPPDMAKSNLPFAHALGMRSELGTGKVNMRFFYGADRPGGPGNLLSTIRGLYEGRQHVESLKVGVREDVDCASEVLNLLGHHDVDEIPNEELEQTPGRRYSRESRLRAIKTVFKEWLQKQ